MKNKDIYVKVAKIRTKKNTPPKSWKRMTETVPFFPVYKPMGCINRKSFSLKFFLHFACIPCINRPPPSERDTPCYLNSPESLPVNNV